MRQKSEPEWAAFVAIDWADQKHFWRLVPAPHLVFPLLSVSGGGFVAIISKAK